MKTKVALLTIQLIFMQSVSVLHAQNFKTIYSNSTSHFSYHVPFNSNQTFFNTISIDSAVITPSGDELYNFVSLDFYSLPYGSAPSSRSTWIASKIFQDVNGSEYFLNSTNDTVFILPQAALASSWHLFNYANGDYIEATVSNISTQTFLGLSDDVKTIQLAAKNNGGNPIANNLNGKKIKLSRNYGFIQTLSFKNFPTDTTAFYLAGLSNPQSGIINLTADSIFNFNIGDEFHYHTEYSAGIAITDKYYGIKKVLSKSYTINNDSVIYTYDCCSRGEHYNFSNYTFSTSHDTCMEKFDISPTAFLNKLSFQLFDTSAAGYQIYNNGFLNFFSDTNYLSRIKKTIHAYYYYYPNDSAFTVLIGAGIFPDITYASGLGPIHMEDFSCFGSGCFSNLIYYKKGSEIWGTPLNCAALLSVVENSNTTNTFRLSPNPVTNFLTLNFSFPPSGKIKVMDIYGNIVLQKEITAAADEIKLSVEKLSAGIYFVNVEGENNFKPVKFCKL